MPIFLLGKEPIFPPVEMTTKEGILAVGGDLSVERLINAYSSGIFPWYSRGEPIIWWSPDPRMVLFPNELHIPELVKRILNNKRFQVTLDSIFVDLIKNCQQVRKTPDETWITDEMFEAYVQLHQLGYAHSVEVWLEEKLVGGLYGVSLGKCFFGESMFYTVTNASKIGLITLVQKIKKRGFLMVDCQVKTKHLALFGAREISRIKFLLQLKRGLKYKTILGKWDF